MKPLTAFILAAGALAFTATPAPARLNAMLEAVQVSAASHGFSSDLLLARMEAMRRGSRIVVCKSADGERCTTRGSWSQGWIAFDDKDGNGTRGAGERLVLRERAFARTLRALGSLNDVHAVAFAPTGDAKFVGGKAQAGALTVCRESFDRSAGSRVTFVAGRTPQLRREPVAACA